MLPSDLVGIQILDSKLSLKNYGSRPESSGSETVSL